MSVQREFLVPFIVNVKDKQLPIEAELALVTGVALDRVKKGGLFKKTKEDLTLVSKFYWRIFLDTFEGRLIVVDSLGLYGNGTGIDDLSLNNVEANLRAIKSSTSINAFTESLMDANNSLMLTQTIYSVFDENFSKSTFELVKKSLFEGNIDTPLILPTFERKISENFIGSIREINRLVEIQDELRELSLNWLATINEDIKSIEGEYANRINRTQQDVDTRLVQYEEKMNTQIDSELQKANQAIYKALTKFEGSTLGLTGIITPLQEDTRKVLQKLPSTETPKFTETVKIFLDTTKVHIGNISNKVKELDAERKQLEKAINDIVQNQMNNKQRLIDEYETNKDKALHEVDGMRQKRDEMLSNLVDTRDSIKATTEELQKKIQTAIDNRKFLARTSTFGGSGNVPENVLLSFFIIRFQEKDKMRYFVVPPLTGGSSKPDFPMIQMDAAIKGVKHIADKIAAELVFDRRLKDSLNALFATNFIATGEYKGAIIQGFNYLVENKIIDKKAARRITESLDELGIE